MDFEVGTSQEPIKVPLHQYRLFDCSEIHELLREPIRSAEIAKLMEKYETEQEYIESLNLRQVISEVFKTLERSLVKI